MFIVVLVGGSTRRPITLVVEIVRGADFEAENFLKAKVVKK